MNVCVAPSRVLSAPAMGGHAWVYLNWTLGLQANGCNVAWLERFHPEVTADDARRQLRHLRASMQATGVNAPIALIISEEQRDRLHDIRDDIAGCTAPLTDVMSECDLLLNFYYELEGELLKGFRRTVLIDIDPGLLQHWMHQGQLRVAEHDLYFTIGETVGRPDSRIPDVGLEWHYTPPAVHTAAWPVTSADSGDAYTTVSTWWSTWEAFGGETFSNEKRTSFLDYVDLPAHASVPLELALCMTADEQSDREMLRGRGWRVQDAWQVCSTPDDYRAYIQRSRGEFSCAKPSCMRLLNAWISDRTLCYLASGKPAVVQYTGPSRLLPDGEGLFRFQNVPQAVRSLEAAEADYDRHSRLARELVVEHFDAEKVAGRLLERVVP